MELAVASGQPFATLLTWHPRDVDTLEFIFEEQASEARMQQARDNYQRQMG